MAFVYQGDEIGMIDGPGATPPRDRAGRDPHRHPLQWEPDAERAGFTTGSPWLPPVDPLERSVAAQREDPESLLALYRALIALRRTLAPGLRTLPAAPGVVAFARGDRAVAVNTTAREQPAPDRGDVVLATHPGALADGSLHAHSAVITALD